MMPFVSSVCPKIGVPTVLLTPLYYHLKRKVFCTRCYAYTTNATNKVLRLSKVFIDFVRKVQLPFAIYSKLYTLKWTTLPRPRKHNYISLRGVKRPNYIQHTFLCSSKSQSNPGGFDWNCHVSKGI